MSAVNFSEVIGHYVRNGVTEAQVRQVLDPLPLDIVPFDMELAYVAGLLLPATGSAGLSSGDRACLSLARRLGCRAMTSDRAWTGIAAEAGVEIELIRS